MRGFQFKLFLLSLSVVETDTHYKMAGMVHTVPENPDDYKLCFQLFLNKTN